MDKQAVQGCGDLNVTLRVENMKFKHALAWLCYQNGLAYTVSDKAIRISTPEKLAEAAKGAGGKLPL